MTDESMPNIEQLQAQILELQQQNEANSAKVKDLEDKNAKLNEDLGNARSLNAKLMRNLPAGEEEKEKEEDSTETQDEFFDSFINPAIKKLGKR